MADFGISTSKKGPSSVPLPPWRAQFVWGSEPRNLRAPRIKPITDKTPRDYGKSKPGFGNTGMGGES